MRGVRVCVLLIFCVFSFTAIFPVCFTKTLEVNHLAFPEELDGLAHVRFLDQAENVLIGGAGFLLCGQILCQVGDGVALHLEFTGVEGDTCRCRGPYAYGVIHIVGGKAALFDFFHGEIAGQLMNDGADHLHVCKFFRAYLVFRNVPNQALFYYRQL